MKLFRVLIFALAVAGRLCAQTYEQVAPQLPVLPDPPLAPASLAALPVLRGLVFLPTHAALQPEGRALAGVQVEGLPALDTEAFRRLAAGWLGRPVSVAGLKELTRAVVQYCREHDRPVVDVIVPEQNIQTGTVQILVLEGRVGRVRVEGNRWFSSAVIAGAVRQRAGEAVSGQTVREDLAWLNQNPFRQVDLLFVRGENPGETDLLLRTQDRRPWRFYTGYEDSGNALTGFDRVQAGFNWGNALGLGQQASYQVSASPGGREFVAHAGSYVVPLSAWQHTLTVFGCYAESRPKLAGGDFSLHGRTWQASARYRVPLPASGALSHDLTAGFDFKRSNNNLAFGGMDVFAQANDVVQGILTYTASRPDRLGATSGQLTLAFSPGGFSSGNHTTDFQAARALARADYGYARLELMRRTTLPAGWVWLVRGTAQLASANLLGSEQLGLGGNGGLRGYEEREANGDDGFMIVNELHGPPVRLARALGLKGDDRLDPLVFFDYGVVGAHRRLPDEAVRYELASAGVGLRYTFGPVLSIRADYGWQLKASGLSDGRRASRGHLSLTLAY